MTPSEAAVALGMCAAFDRRTVGETDARAWAEALPDIDITDAKRAIVAHYRERRDWIMPANIYQTVKAERRGRLSAGSAIDGIPDADPDDVAAYQDALRTNRLRIAAGESTFPVAAMVASIAQTTTIPRSAS